MRANAFRAKTLFFFCLFFATFNVACSQNPGPGPSIANSYSNGSDFDHIDVTNGSLSIHYPLFRYPAANGHTQTVSLLIDGTTAFRMAYPCQYVNGLNCSASYRLSDRYNGSRIALDDNPHIGATLIDGHSTQLLYEMPNPIESAWFTRYAKTYMHYVEESDGTRHTLIPETGSNNLRARTIDGSGYLEILANANDYQNGQIGILYNRRGDRIDSTGTHTTNGITLSGTPYSARTATPAELRGCPDLALSSQAVSGGDVFLLAGPSDVNNGIIQLLVCYTNVNYHTNFLHNRGLNKTVGETRNGTGPLDPEPTPHPVSITYIEAGSTLRQIQSVVFPDKSYIAFTYDAGATSDAIAYGNLTAMRLRTGAWIRYSISELPSCSNVSDIWKTQTGLSIAPYSGQIRGRTIDSNDQNPLKWTYLYPGSGQNQTATVYGPDKTVKYGIDTYSSGSDYSCGARISSVEEDSLDGTKLHLRTIHYATYDNPMGFSSLPELYGIQDKIAFPDKITDSVPAVSDTVTTNQYASTFSVSQPFCTADNHGDGCIWTSTGGFDIPYGLVTSSTVTGDDGASGSLTKTVATHYWWEGHPEYFRANLYDLVSSVTTSGTGGNGTTVSYSFDETDLGSPDGVRGNQTTGSVTGSQGGSDSLRTAYDASGRVAKTVHGGLTVNYAYSDPAALFPSSTTWPTTNGVAHQTSSTWDANTGSLTSSLDQNGITTNYQYHGPMGELTLVEAAVGQSTHTSTAYNYSSPNVTITKRDLSSYGDGKLQAEQDLDPIGRVATTVGTDGSKIAYTYDSAGRVQSISNPFGAQASSGSTGSTTFTYDSLGRKASECYSDGSCQQWTYSGNVAVHQDEAKNSQQSTVDALGRLVRVDELGSLQAPLSLTTKYTYDIQNNLLTTSQAGAAAETARSRSFTYDALSHLLTSSNPETGTVCYGTWSGGSVGIGSCQNGYDANGNLQAKTDARGKTVSYTYDALNRLTYKTAQDSSVANHYTYDQTWIGWGMPHFNAIGRLVRSEACNTKGCNDETFSYDAMGRIDHVESASPSEAGQAHVVASQYDLAGDETQTYYGHHDNGDMGGITIGRSYDSAGRLNTVFQKARNGIPLSTPYNLISSVIYLPNGSPNAITYGNGITETIRQNSRQQVCDIGVDDSVTTFLRRGYYYSSGTPNGDGCTSSFSNNNGNIWHVLDTTSALARGPYTQDFEYDSLNRLTSWKANYATGGPRAQAYHYDSFGNLKQTNGYSQDPKQTGTSNARSFPSYSWTSPTDWPYDTKNRLKSATFDCATAQAGDPSNPWYDLAGNVLCGGSNADMNAQQYLWDADSRISQINSEHLNNTYTLQATYVYDGDGNRVNASQYDAGGHPVTFRDSIRYQGSILWDENGGQGLANSWNDYVYAFGKRIARVDASAPVLHLRGTRDNGIAAWGVEGPVNGLATNVAGMVIQPGDKLIIDERQDMVTYGGLTLFTHDSAGNVICACEIADTVTGAPTFFNSFSDGRWHHFAADLSAHAGETIYYVVAGIHNSAPPTGTFDLRLANAVLVHANGSLDPLFSPSTTVTNFQPNFSGGAVALSSGVSADTVQSASASSSATVTIFYANDANDNGDRNLFIIGLTSGGQPVDLSGATYTGCHDGPGLYCNGSLTVTVPGSDTLQVTARGSLSNGAGPRMQIYFNGVLAGHWDVTTTNSTFTFQPPVVPDPMAITYYVSDQVGTAQMEFSAFGGPKWKGEFAPFGQELDTQPTSNRYKFTSKERDTESGLDYFGARYYASSMGRFMSPDWSAQAEPVPYAKLGHPQSLNLYSYMLNNPLAGVDADGHWPEWLNAVGRFAGSVGMGLVKTAVNAINFIGGDCSCQSRLASPMAPSNGVERATMITVAVASIAVPVVDAAFGGSASVSATAPAAIETQAATSTSLIQANAAQGAAWEDAVGASLRQTDPNTASQVTLETQSGVRTRMDFVSQDGKGNVVLTEAKSSATAPLTPNQAAAHPEIANTGATVVGQGKPGYPRGTPIPPTPVNIVRPQQ